LKVESEKLKVKSLREDNTKMKTNFLKTLVCLLVLFASNPTQGQVKLGNNISNVQATAILEIESTSKGMLPPRMTTAQRDAIASPATGLLIYNIDKACNEFFNGTGWFNECTGQATQISPGGGNTSSGGTAVVSAWTSDIGCNIGAGNDNNPAGIRQGGVNQTMVQGVSATGTVTITLRADVTTAGTYRIATNTINGVSFVGSGTFASTGLDQTVTLTATGSPLLAGNFMWTTNLTPSINVYGSVITTTAPLGSTYNAHFNGITNEISVDHTLSTYTTGEIFSNNTACTSKHISAQGCGGLTHVTGTSGRRYSLIDINGQCWMQQNLNDVPSFYSNYTTTSWTNTSPGDQGYWGYYNTSSTGGSAGWQTTEPATNEGLLYQWCGVMNATISERSRGACPTGFHVPSDCEWMFLEHGQGMSITEQIKATSRANTNDNQGTPGYKLRSAGTGQTNVSGFSGLLAGFRNPSSGTFNHRSVSGIGFFWTSSAVNNSSASYRLMQSGSRGLTRNTAIKPHAYSVRCLKD
jgi:uncharacterized protein (TIGR02145 family)